MASLSYVVGTYNIQPMGLTVNEVILTAPWGVIVHPTHGLDSQRVDDDSTMGRHSISDPWDSQSMIDIVSPME